MTRTKSGKYKFEQLEDNSMTTGRFNGVGGWKVDVYRGRWVMMGMMGFADIQRFLNDIIHTSRHQQRECSGILFFQVLETRALLCYRTTEDFATRAPSQREYISKEIHWWWWYISSLSSSPSRCLKPLSAGSSTTLRWTDLTETRWSLEPPELNRFFLLYLWKLFQIENDLHIISALAWIGSQVYLPRQSQNWFANGRETNSPITNKLCNFF